MMASPSVPRSGRGVRRDMSLSRIAERCLAHERKSAVEASYDREEMLEDRRERMEKWARFLSGADADNVVSIKREVA